MSKRIKDKDLEKLDVIKDSPQMSLFEIIESPAKKDDYSNTIEIYDALPKYVGTKSVSMKIYPTL